MFGTNSRTKLGNRHIKIKNLIHSGSYLRGVNCPPEMLGIFHVTNQQKHTYCCHRANADIAHKH